MGSGLEVEFEQDTDERIPPEFHGEKEVELRFEDCSHPWVRGKIVSVSTKELIVTVKALTETSIYKTMWQGGLLRGSIEPIDRSPLERQLENICNQKASSLTKPEVADIRLVGVLGISNDMCNVVLVRPDAPDFKTPKDALQWLNGKIMAAPKGSCVDRFVLDAFKKENIKPESYLNQNIEVITSNFRAKKIDGAAIWEPTASKLVEEGLAKRVASGYTVGLSDGAFLAMRDDLIKARPDIAQAWMNAELDAQLFLADEKNAKEVIDIGMAYTTGFTRTSIAKSVYGQSPDQMGSKVRFTLPFTFTPDARKLVVGATSFLKEMKAINVAELRSDAIVTKFADEALKARNLKAPVGDVTVINPAPN
jgi:NitT/TauT family transport system substrate-binding protein